MALTDGLKDFHKWWRWEIAEFSKRRSKQPQTGSRIDSILEIHRDGILVHPSGETGATSPARASDAGEAAELVRAVVGKSRRAKLCVDLVVGPDRVLCRQLSSSRLPISRWKSMAMIDCAVATPVDPSGCYVILPDYDDRDPTSLYFVVKKSVLDRILSELRRSGIAISKIAMMRNDQRFDASLESFREIVPAAMESLRRKVNVLMVVGLAGLVCAFFGTIYWNQSKAFRSINARIQTAQKEASIVRSVIKSRDDRFAQLAAARAEKTGSVAFIRIIEEMARTIPDTTFLDEINLNNGTVSFSGISPAAALLIPNLEASPLFRTPSFTRPVIRALNQNGERFTISMEIEEPNE